MLLERDREGDRGRAIAYLDEASGAAQKMGMAHLAEKIDHLQARYDLVSL